MIITAVITAILVVLVFGIRWLIRHDKASRVPHPQGQTDMDWILERLEAQKQRARVEVSGIEEPVSMAVTDGSQEHVA